MQSLHDIWTPALEILTEKTSDTIADLWFNSLTLHSITDSQAIVVCDMPFKYTIIKSKYKEIIEDALASVIGFAVELVVLDKTSNPEEYASYIQNDADIPEPVNLADRVTAPAAVSQNPGDKPQGGSYNQYTFDNFIVGQSNKFAHAACIAVSNEPSCLTSDSSAYNPLFIYGPSGLGKTHLLYAVINHLKSKFPHLKIVYVKGEEFTTQLIDSISKKTPEQFRAKYRTADVLLIDDIQFIAGRDSTQEEFFHTFNALYEDHKQIILTSDRPPRDIKTLEDRLKTRFEWGITADIQPPDADLRAAIIKNKAESINVKLDNNVINFLAENLKNNIRQVEGAIKKLGALNVLTGAPINEELARSTLADLITGDDSPEVTVDRIFERVSKKCGVTVEDIKGDKRTKEIKYARHLSIYLIRKLTNLSLPQIGKLLKRDHSTIISSLKGTEKEMGLNNQTSMDIAELMKDIKA